MEDTSFIEVPICSYCEKKKSLWEIVLNGYIFCMSSTEFYYRWKCENCGVSNETRIHVMSLLSFTENPSR